MYISIGSCLELLGVNDTRTGKLNTFAAGKINSDLLKKKRSFLCVQVCIHSLIDQTQKIFDF